MSLSGFIWDLDNTLYRYEAMTLHHGAVAAAHLARELGVDLPLDDLILRGEESVNQYGTSYHYMVHEFGIPEATAHLEFNKRLDVNLVAKKNHEIVEAFTHHPGQHVLLTHASRDWAERMLEHLGLSAFFPSAHILPIEEVGYARKNLGPEPFQQALAKLGLPAGEVAMLEDSAINLVHAHALGLWTAYIHHGKPLSPQPDYVKSQFANAAEALAGL